MLADIKSVLEKYEPDSIDFTETMGQLLMDIGVAYEDMKPYLSQAIIEEVESSYYSNPTLGKALILQGLIMKNWTIKN
jgi:hypothetical protein